MNRAGIDLLKHYEGFKANAYRDLVGVWTIGYGFTKDVKPDDTITQDEADARLMTELTDFESRLGVTGAPNQQAAMTCLAYNIGSGNFNSSTVKRKHLAGDFLGAADAFRMWDKAGGRVVYGLVRRRESERTLYLTP